jgi:CubicO group peptidase (beta-lactamase class C family)
MINNLFRAGGVALFALPCAWPSVALAIDVPAAELVGLWAARRDFTPDVSGSLAIRQVDGDLLAEIGGYQVVASQEQGEIRFAVPGDRGYFRGRFSFDHETIQGHWVQPRTQSGFASFASPVELSKDTAGHWRGSVIPLQDQLHFYLVIEKMEDGRIGAFMRNPEANIGRFYRIEEVVRDGDKVQFRDESGRTRLEGTYHSESGQLSIYFLYNGGTYDFVRADEDGGSPFFTRPMADQPYRYTKPLPGNGWETASLAEARLARRPIEDMIKMIIDTPMSAIDAPYIHAILIARHGKLVLEEYFHGYSGDTPHATRSAAKSITTTLVGIAIHEGLLSLDAPVYETMYKSSLPPELHPRAARMTLRHLITMTPGFACDDADQDSPGNEDAMQNQEAQPDWYQFTLDLPMIHEPGTHAAYCSASQNLAGGVLSRATGEWLPGFYRKHFAEPLETGLYHMNLTPVGDGYGGGGLYILPRDFLKLGQLYLNDGLWKGRRLLDPGWAAAATTPYNKIWKEEYGYGWWIFSYSHKGREVNAYYAGGNGGQYVIVIPEFDLNIVGFGGNYNQRVMHQLKYEYVRDYVLPAIVNEKAVD